MQPTNTPSPYTVLPHYAFAAVAFLVLNVLLLFAADAFGGHYFHPKLLTLTHVAALGWGTVVIFGALYQLLPVVLEVRIWSERLAQLTFVLLGLGTVLLAVAFWNFWVGAALITAAGLLLLSFCLFLLNIYLSTRTAPKWPVEGDFILTSSIWLLLTGVVGFLMAINFTHPFLPESHLHYLKLHAHLGMGGWFLLLIIGVSSRLIPMFMLAHPQQKGRLTVAYYCVNAGLLLFALDHLVLHTPYQWVYGLLVAIGVGCYLWFLQEANSLRLRRDQDPGMKLSLVALLLMLLPVALVFVVNQEGLVSEALAQHLYLVYGISVFMGFITALILGQTYKTLPFIVWMHRYQDHVGRFKTPLPKDLYSQRLAHWQNALYLPGLLLLLAGVLLAERVVVTAGSSLLLAAAVLYVVNVGKILFHSVQLEPVPHLKQQTASPWRSR